MIQALVDRPRQKVRRWRSGVDFRQAKAYVWLGNWPIDISEGGSECKRGNV